MNFETKGCKLIGIFDKDEKLKNEKIAGTNISNITEINDFCKKNHPDIAILCIPKTAAQEIADELINLGIKAFWNFSHYDLKVDYKDVVVENVHLGDSLLTLTYSVNHQS